MEYHADGSEVNFDNSHLPSYSLDFSLRFHVNGKCMDRVIILCPILDIIPSTFLIGFGSYI